MRNWENSFHKQITRHSFSLSVQERTDDQLKKQ